MLTKILTNINKKISELVKNFLTLIFIGLIFSSIFITILSSEFSIENVWASPNPLVIDFEDLSDRDFIFNQYANLGVIFHGSSVKDFSQSPGFAHSGVKAIQPCPLSYRILQFTNKTQFYCSTKSCKGVDWRRISIF